MKKKTGVLFLKKYFSPITIATPGNFDHTSGSDVNHYEMRIFKKYIYLVIILFSGSYTSQFNKISFVLLKKSLNK